MPEREPVIETLEATDVCARWGEILDQVFHRQTRVVVEQSGAPVVAVISVEDLERFTRLERQRRERFQALADSWAAFEDVDPARVEQEVAQAVASARQKLRERAPRTP